MYPFRFAFLSILLVSAVFLTQCSRQPRATPVLTPLVQAGTPLPQSLEMITVANTARLVPLAHWGPGAAETAQFTADGQQQEHSSRMGAAAFIYA